MSRPFLVEQPPSASGALMHFPEFLKKKSYSHMTVDFLRENSFAVAAVVLYAYRISCRLPTATLIASIVQLDAT